MSKLLKCLAVVIGVLGLLAGGCSQQDLGLSFQEAKPVNTLGVRLKSYGKYEESAPAHLKSLGVRYIEIPAPLPYEVEAIQEKYAAYDLRPIMLTGRADLASPRCVEELAEQTAICRRMGVRYLFLSAKSQGAGREVACQRLWKAGDVARANGVTIVLEMHPDLLTNGDMARATMQRIRHPNVRVNFDTGNIYYYNQGRDAVTELEKIAEYVESVHLKDTDGGFESWNFPALGKGVVDFKAVVRTLNQRSFTGPFIVEIEGVKGQAWTEAETLQAVADSVAHLRSFGDFR